MYTLRPRWEFSVADSHAGDKCFHHQHTVIDCTAQLHTDKARFFPSPLKCFCPGSACSQHGPSAMEDMLCITSNCTWFCSGLQSGGHYSVGSKVTVLPKRPFISCRCLERSSAVRWWGCGTPRVGWLTQTNVHWTGLEDIVLYHDAGTNMLHTMFMLH